MARSWEEMRTSIAARLVRQTGHDVAWWNEAIAAAERTSDEASLRAWRPILDTVVAVAAALGEVEVQARKTYATLLTPRRTFAAVRPTTKTRVDLGLRIDGEHPGGRLLDGRNTAAGSVNLRLPLSTIDDVDDEAFGLLRRAYQANL